MYSYSQETGEKSYNADANVSHRLIVAAVVFIVIEVLTLVLRVCARRMQRTGFMWSDVFMPLSLLFNIAVCTCALLAVRWGGGRHAAAIPQSDIPPFMLLSYYAMPEIYLFAITLPRLAVLDLYLNIFVDRFSRWATWTTGAVIIASLVGNFVAIADRCSSPHQLWNPTPGGWCLNLREHCTWASFPNIVTDFFMLLLPLPVIYRLRTTWQKKVGVLLTFLVGSFGLATSIIRFVSFWRLSWNVMHSDPTWALVDVLVWTLVEPGVYHIAGCCITYASIVRWLFHESPLSSTLSKVHGSNDSASSEVGFYRNLHGDSVGGSREFRSDHPDFVPREFGFSESCAYANHGSRSPNDFERRIVVETDFDVTKSNASDYEKRSPTAG